MTMNVSMMKWQATSVPKDDERLDDEVASYKRAEEIQPDEEFFDPYRVKKAEEKPAAKRQEPVLRNFMPEVAPEHNEADRLINKKAEQRAAREEAAKRAQTAQEPSLIRRLINFLFGSSEKTEDKKDDEKKTRGDRRSRRNPRDRREKDNSRRQRRERTPRAEKEEEKSAPVEKTETAEKVKPSEKETVRETQTRRRPRRRVKSEETPELLPAPEAKVALPKPVQSVPEPVKNDEDFNFATDTIPNMEATAEAVEPAEPVAAESQAPAAERRPRRRRRPADESMTRRDRIPPEVEAEEMNRAPIVPPEEYMQESTVRTAPLDESELHAELQKEPAEPRHVNVENRIANQKREPVAQRPRAEEVVVEAEGDKNEEAAVAAETVEVAATAPAVEETVEVKAEQKTQSALERLTEGLDEALAKNGLTVVHTKPELVHPVDYSPVIYPGRPRKVLPPLDDTPLIQVHTTKF